MADQEEVAAEEASEIPSMKDGIFCHVFASISTVNRQDVDDMEEV